MKLSGSSAARMTFAAGPYKEIYNLPLSNRKYGRIYTHGAPYLNSNMRRIWGEHRIKTVVSLLEKEEQGESTYSVPHINFPIQENDIPKDISSFTRLVLRLLNKVTAGQNISIHCHTGVGRTGILATILAGILEGLSGEMSIVYTSMHKASYILNKHQYKFVCWFIDESIKKPSKKKDPKKK